METLWLSLWGLDQYLGEEFMTCMKLCTTPRNSKKIFCVKSDKHLIND